MNHVKWYFNVRSWKPTKFEWLNLTSCIEHDELDRINKYVFQEDMKSSLIGRALIRKLVAKAYETTSKDVILKRTELGRPVVCREYQEQGKRVMDFNISHSGDYCVLTAVWSPSQFSMSVGIDVTRVVKKETPQEVKTFLDLMSKREFNTKEWRYVTSPPEDRQKLVNFTRLWCLKESFIKAIGLGLKFKLNRINFEISPSEMNPIVENHGKDILKGTVVAIDGVLQQLTWTFNETSLDYDHIVAIAYQFDGPQISSVAEFRYEDVKFEEITINRLLTALEPMRTPDDEHWTKYSTSGTKE